MVGICHGGNVPASHDDANDDDGNDDFQTEAARLRAEATALQDALSNHRETCR